MAKMTHDLMLKVLGSVLADIRVAVEIAEENATEANRHGLDMTAEDQEEGAHVLRTKQEAVEQAIAILTQQTTSPAMVTVTIPLEKAQAFLRPSSMEHYQAEEWLRMHLRQSLSSLESSHDN